MDPTAMLMARLSEVWAGLPHDYSVRFELGERLNPLIYDTPNGVVPASFVAAWSSRGWVSVYKDLSANEGHLTLTKEGQLIVWAFDE